MEDFRCHADHPRVYCFKACVTSERTFDPEGRKGPMRPCLYSTVLTALALIGLLVPHAFGQATITFAQLNGTVLDTSGRALVKAAIAVREVDTNRSYSAVS